MTRCSSICFINALSLCLSTILLASASADDLDDLHSAVRDAGDVDGDGVCDLLIADRVPIPGVTWIVSGSSGRRLLALRPDRTRQAIQSFPASMDRVGDLNGDGLSEVIVCWRTTPGWEKGVVDPGATGHACVYCGRDGGIMFVFRDTWTVAAAGDINGDRVPDVLLGASHRWRSAQPGRVQVRSGCDGTLLLEKVGPEMPLSGACVSITTNDSGEPAFEIEADGDIDWPDFFGHSLAGLGDVDGDGRGDFAVGSPEGNMAFGVVEIFSGRDGHLIARKGGWSENDLGVNFGWSMAPAGDLDGDGVCDLLVGAIHRYAAVCSGRDLRVLHTVPSRYRWTSADAFGTSIDIVGDIDGDGMNDWIVGANESSPELFDMGYAETHSGRDARLLRVEFESSSSVDRRCGVDVCGLSDVNRDGVADFAIALPAKSRVEICSGRDGAIIHEIDVAKLRTATSKTR